MNTELSFKKIRSYWQLSIEAEEVLIALEAGSREEVQKIVATAKSMGASIYAEAQDHGWMYQHSFADLDGHQWEFAYMDMSKLPNNS